jgi:hypothetical protein
VLVLDLDDNNYGVSDADEIAQGRNPLFNEDILPAILPLLE